jgi:hypothetical protein
MEVQAIGIEPPLELQHYDRVNAEKKAFFMNPALGLVPVQGCQRVLGRRRKERASTSR